MDKQRGTAWIAFMALYVGALPELLPAPAYGTIDRLTGKLDRRTSFCADVPGTRWEIPDRAKSPKGLHETEIQKAEIRKAAIRKIVGIAEKIVH